MPLYEYQCPECGARTERMRKLSERANGPGCAECGTVTTLALSAPGRVGGGEGRSAGNPASSGPVSPCGPGGCGVSFN
jgi:putative FmdB family regulatory protein